MPVTLETKYLVGAGIVLVLALALSIYAASQAGKAGKAGPRGPSGANAIESILSDTTVGTISSLSPLGVSLAGSVVAHVTNFQVVAIGPNLRVATGHVELIFTNPLDIPKVTDVAVDFSLPEQPKVLAGTASISNRIHTTSVFFLDQKAFRIRYDMSNLAPVSGDRTSQFAVTYSI